ncbi:hypothetical protein [Flavobacterium sp.]|uniref:hypothetical protein n=1 Tax=Flavobacterium sp. TaxID=239 RepID=UPI002636DA76|nr:hypothetical protein [Flavobacterium sp.]MDG2432947.1 hypothetical protein [Flavobacterium sp.]
MNLENQLLQKFQVEELEKRYEMKAWISDGSTSAEGVIDQAPTPNDPLGPMQDYPAVKITIGF